MANTVINTPELLNLDSTTGATVLAKGTINERPTTAIDGTLRFNTDTNKTEYYDGTGWYEIVDEYASGFIGPATNYFDTKLYTGNGSTQSIGGYINGSASFNGSSSYISTTNPLGTGNVAYTVSAWININTSSHTGGIYTIWDGGTNAGTYLFFKVEGGKISIGNYGSSVTSTNTLSVGQWVHVAVTRDTSNNVVLYVNGSSDTTGTLSLNLANNPAKIGALNTTTQTMLYYM